MKSPVVKERRADTAHCKHYIVDEFLSVLFASPGHSGAFAGGRSVPCTAQHHHNVQVLRAAPSFRSLASVSTGKVEPRHPTGCSKKSN